MWWPHQLSGDEKFHESAWKTSFTTLIFLRQSDQQLLDKDAFFLNAVPAGGQMI